MSPKFHTDSSQCVHCSICSQVCPKGLIRMVKGLPTMTEEASKRCNDCGQCVAYCPQGCASQHLSEHFEMPKAFSFDHSKTEDLLRFLQSRRSYRNFQSAPVDENVMTAILETANYAPSGGNNRKLRWIVLKSPEKTKALTELIAQWFDKGLVNTPSTENGMRLTPFWKDLATAKMSSCVALHT